MFSALLFNLRFSGVCLKFQLIFVLYSLKGRKLKVNTLKLAELNLNSVSVWILFLNFCLVCLLFTLTLHDKSIQPRKNFKIELEQI